MYGTLVIAYLFLGGASGGTFLVTATWSLALHHLYPHRSALVRRDFRLLRERIYAIATAVLAAAMLCLLWDLNYPDRALMIFAFARPTVLTFGACALTALLAISFWPTCSIFASSPAQSRASSKQHAPSWP